MGTYDTRGGTPASPDEPCYDSSELVNKILEILEAAGCPESVNDKIVELIEDWEPEHDTAREGQKVIR